VRRYWDKEYAIEIYQKPIQKVGEKIPSSRLSNSVHRKAGTFHVVILIYYVHRTV
jgi:transposase-like protein